MSKESAVPHIPREEWERHPNYPSQVLLLGSHRNFRQISAALVDAARTGEPPGEMFFLYARWIAAMRGHEAYEERKLYPYLSARWGVSFEASEAGHAELHDAHELVLAAFDSGIALAEALEKHDAVLREHLDVEEQQVIPLLLALSAREFNDYYHARVAS